MSGVFRGAGRLGARSGAFGAGLGSGGAGASAAGALCWLRGHACAAAGGIAAAAGGHGSGDRSGVDGQGRWAGYRRIAAVLGRPAETVRGWLRRFAGRVESVRRVFTVLLRAVAADPVMPEPAGSGWADAVCAIGAAAAVVGGRFAVFMVPVWQWVSAVSGGRLLAPGWPAEWINTS